MAAKKEHSFQTKLVSLFKASSCRSDDDHIIVKESESLKQKVSNLSSKIGQVFQRVQLSQTNSPPSLSQEFPKSPKMKNSPKMIQFSPKHSELYSSTVSELPPKMKEQVGPRDKLCSNIAVISPRPHKLSSDLDLDTFSPKRQNMSTMTSEGRCRRERNTLPEVFIFPPVSEAPAGVKQRSFTAKSVRFQSEGGRSAYRKPEKKQRQRVESEPCISKYTNLINSRGIQLTEAANDLTEEQCRLLYEDIFKPLDICSMLLERSKNENIPKGEQGSCQELFCEW